MNAARPTLRGRFLRIVSLPLLSCYVLFWIMGLAYVYHEVDEMYDATLAQYAREIDRLSEHSTFGPLNVQDASEVHHKYERKIMFRILQNGQVVATSPMGTKFSELLPKTGFYDRYFSNDRWRIFALVNADTGRTVEVGEKYDIRREISRQLMGSLLVPALLFLSALLAVVWWGATASLKRLVALSAEVDARDVNDMTPLSDSRIPQEVAPLFLALNRLFVRVSDSFLREREFTDNAAHELRTPLAAIKMQAQVLAKQQESEGVKNLMSAIDRAVNMVDALLSFTRLQSGAPEMADVDFSALVRDELDSLLRYSAWKNRNVKIDIAPGVVLRGSAQGLAIMVRNIVLNALKFTPEAGNITVTLDKSRFTVTDTGPGIPDELKEKVFERFFKGTKSNATGSGLGLAMVRWAADAHGMTLALSDNAPTGLKFEAVFTPATQGLPPTLHRSISTPP